MAQTTGKPKSLAEALAAFQSIVKTAKKTGSAQDRGNKVRKYATLEDLLDALQPAIDLGLTHSQTFEYVPLENGVLTVLVTTVFFGTEQIESKLVLPDIEKSSRGNIWHALGTGITYSRRYALGAIYGIGSEDDDDAMSLNETPKKKGISRTPTKPDKEKAISPEPAKNSQNDGAWIDPQRKERIVGQLRTLDSDTKKSVLDAFRKECNITSAAITPDHIQTSVHGAVFERLLGLGSYKPV